MRCLCTLQQSLLSLVTGSEVEVEPFTQGTNENSYYGEELGYCMRSEAVKS